MKMKLLRLLPLVIIVLCQNVFAQDQMKYWALPPYKIDFSAATPATTLLPGSNVSTPYVVSNAAYDEFGNVVFYVKNDDVYSATGMPAGTLPNMSDGGYTYHYIQNEITIVPVPGTCKDFYVFYVKGAGPYSVGLCCARVSISSSGIITLTPSLIEVNGGNIMSIATSKLDPSTNTRYLYCVAKYSVTRHTISSSGISSATVIASGHAAGGSAYELELSADGSTLAWGNWYGTGSAGTITTMALTGSKPGLTYTFSLPGAIQSCYGLEFSPDPDYLYASINSGTTGSSGLYKLKRSTSTFTKLTSNTYNHTQLERARDGYIYAVNGDGYSSGTLGRINPATDNIDNNILSIPIISNQSSLLSSYVYRLPDQVDGDNYDYFFGVAKLNNSIKINGSTVSSTVPVNTYTCSAISLSQTGIGASSYRYTINKTDAAGNVLTGSSAYSFTTGLIASTPPATIDIKALHSGYLGTPLSAGYYYKIDFFVQNSCNSITVSGLIYNSTLSAASANFKLLDGGGNELNPNPVLPGYEVSAFGVGLNGKYSTGYIATYQIKVDKVDCATGAIIAANIVNTPVTAVSNGNPSTISGVSFNSKSSPLGYFMMNAGCFKVTYTVANACGTATPQIGYFYSDPNSQTNFRLASITTSNAEAKMYPNPTTGSTTVAFSLQEDKMVQATLTSMQCGASYTLFTNQSASEGPNEITFDTGSIPAGMYLYQLSDGSDTFQTGKLVIVK